METGGNMFETEIYQNLFRGSFLIELDRVGVFQDLEIGDQELPEGLLRKEVQMDKQTRWSVSLQAEDRIRRLQSLLDALNLLWGGGRTARMLADLSPKFLAYARLSVKHPVFLEALEAQFSDGAYHLVLTPLTNALERFKGQIETAIFGIEPAFLSNEDEVRNVLSEYGAVATVSEAIQSAKEDLKKAWSF